MYPCSIIHYVWYAFKLTTDENSREIGKHDDAKIYCIHDKAAMYNIFMVKEKMVCVNNICQETVRAALS